jgi:general secretion pathway protein G
MVYRKRELLRAVRRGFTLMEVLVVVAIILILAGLGGYYFLGQAKEAQKSAAKVQIRTLKQAAENYALDHGGTFPANLQALLSKDSYGKGPYLKNQDALVDPWGNQYQYAPPGPNDTEPHVYCQAPDGTAIGN